MPKTPFLPITVKKLKLYLKTVPDSYIITDINDTPFDALWINDVKKKTLRFLNTTRDMDKAVTKVI